jgi:hypothetical protein
MSRTEVEVIGTPGIGTGGGQNIGLQEDKLTLSLAQTISAGKPLRHGSTL